MLEVTFSNYDTYATDSLTQWDTNQSLKIKGMNFNMAPTILFTNRLSVTTKPVPSTLSDDGFVCSIPNGLLTEKYPIVAYIRQTVNNETTTIGRIIIPVIPGAKPEDYTFIENVPVVTYESILSLIGSKVNYSLYKNKISELEITIQTILNNGTTQEQINNSVNKYILKAIEDGTIANLVLADGSVTEKKLDPELLETLKDSGVITGKSGEKYKLIVNENGNITMERVYERFRNKEIISDISFSSFSSDTLIAFDSENDEYIKGFKPSVTSQFSPFKTFTTGGNTEKTKARKKLDANTSGSYSFIVQSADKDNPTYDSSVYNLLNIFSAGNVFNGSTWDHIKIKIRTLYYENSGGEIVTYTPSETWGKYAISELPNNTEEKWNYSFNAFVLESDGSINVYVDNKLMVTYPAPFDFGKWSFKWIDSSWSNTLTNSNSNLDKILILNNSIDLNDLDEYYHYLTGKESVTDIKVLDNLCMMIGESYRFDPVILPTSIKKPLAFTTQNTDIISIADNGTVTALTNGTALLKLTSENFSKEITIKVGNQISNNSSVNALVTREISDIAIVNPISNMKTGDEYALYAIGLSGGNVPYKVTDQNFLNFVSSDPEICAVKFGVLRANKAGSCTITISNINETVKKSFELIVADPETDVIPDRDIYYCNDRTHNIYNNGTHAKETTEGIQDALNYAVENDYRKIVFNKGIYRVGGDYGKISFPSNLTVDFNDSDIILEYGTCTTTGYTMFEMIGENIVLENGHFYGERYEGHSGVEGCITLGVNKTAKDCTTKNCEFLYSPGFNVGLSYSRDSLKGFALANVEAGNIDDLGQVDDTIIAGHFRSKDFIDISTLSKNFGLGNMQGYQGYLYLSSRLYNIYFYDESYTFISMMKYCVQYQVYDLPEGVKYAKIVFFQDNAPTSGDPDFKSIAHLYSILNPKNIKFIGCAFKYAVSTGISPQGGINLLLDNCIFIDNGSRDPASQIDWEDGRIHIQGHIVRNCYFEKTDPSYTATITDCNSRDLVFRNNKVVNCGLSIGSECVNTRIYNNVFENGKISLATKSDMIFSGNTYTVNPIIGDVLEGQNIIMADNLLITE